MSDHAATAHEHPNYVKIWGILLVLLAISVERVLALRVARAL